MMRAWGLGGGANDGDDYHPHSHARRARWSETYHCYSVAFADKAHLEKGDKILLPPSAFDMLARLQVDYPMLFRLTGSSNQRTTHSGVLEFTAEEGCVYIPHWMMQNLLLEEGSLITVTNVSLPKATFVKLQPQSTDFLEITNPRAVLEHALRNYSCVTLHDIIQLPYNGKNYHFELKDVQPSPAACIIETDCNVDFDAPVGYVEPERPDSKQSSTCPSPDTATTASSFGAGMGGSSSNSNDDANDTNQAQLPHRGIRIVDGVIVRPDDANGAADPMASVTDLLAERTGATGVQRNAAIPVSAPESAYWAVAAGDGARLDGKAPAVLRDAKTGQELNIRQLRADAAAARQQAVTASIASTTASTGVVPSSAAAPNGVVSKRKPRVGTKFARLKSGSTTAFQGSAHQMQDDS